MLLDDVVPLQPIHFFALNVDCLYYKGKKETALSKHYRLPDLSGLQGENHWVDVAMGWNEKGLILTIRVHHPLKEVVFPDFTEGDAIELFFDTRDMKQGSRLTRFCHHFFFLPEEVSLNGDVVRAGELTRFSLLDTHPLSDPSIFYVACTKEKREYTLQIFIPALALQGYEPKVFNRLGFTYRIHRAGGTPAHFSTTEKDFPLEEQPALWASIKLKDGEDEI